MKKKLIFLFVTMVCVFSLSVGVFADGDGDIVIIYTNDVHTHITEDITYSKLAAYRDGIPGAILVDAGDHVQGTAFGGMDKGETITEIMNAAGYDVASLGNHEFDYGADGMLATAKRADFPYISCNLYHVKDGKRLENVLDSHCIVGTKGKKIAFIGVLTPETISNTSPVYFQDGNGNFIYGIAGDADGKALYDSVQKAIDDVADEVDYIIGLGHLGTDPSNGAWTSYNVIANTVGFDAFIDAHSHTTIESEIVKDKQGGDVVLAQTGSYFEAVGKMTISKDGSIKCELLSADDFADVAPKAEVKAIEDAWIAEIDSILGKKIADTDITFTILGEDGNRAVRMASTNMSEFNSDAFYWYINEHEQLNCDFAIANGGGVRVTIDAGDWTYNSCKTVNPFGNVLCIIKVSGKTVLDMLEFGARLIGEGENGGLIHTAGLIYEVDTSIPNTVKVDELGVWTGAPDEYRVKNVKVYDRESGAYVPLKLDAVYDMAGANFTLRNAGDGFTMFKDATLVKDYIGEDYLAIAAYAMAFSDIDGDGYPELTTEGSPLAAYKGYGIDYESISGVGKINVLDRSEHDESNGTEYIVKPGDTLWALARKYLGRGYMWGRIYDANLDVISDPRLIFEGQKIIIPAA